MASLFVYGSLMDSDVFYEITKCKPVGYGATLLGFVRLCVRGESYPAVIENETCSVDGLLYRDISESKLAALDIFEGDEYERISVAISIDGQEEIAQLYRYHTSFIHKLGSEPWSFERFCSQKEQFLEICRKSNFVNSRNSVCI